MDLNQYVLLFRRKHKDLDTSAALPRAMPSSQPLRQFEVAGDGNVWIDLATMFIIIVYQHVF